MVKGMLLAPVLLLAQGAKITLPSYLTPPKPLQDACLAPWWKNVTPTLVSPDGKRAIVVDRDGPPPLERLARPYVNLAGLQIDTTAVRERSLTTRSAAGLRVMDLASGAMVPVQVPGGARVSPPKWSPDGRTLAFVVHTDAASFLYVADPLTGASHPLGRRPLMPTLCADWDWTNDGKAIAAVFRPASLPAPPAVPSVAPSPRVQVSDARRTSLRVYASTLKSPYEESLVDYYANGQLATVGLDGKLREIGGPQPIQALDSSSDGRAFRITLLQRPYSSLVPLGSFPQREIVLGADGKELTELSRRGLRTDGGDEAADEQRAPGGAGGRRGATWRPDGSLVFIRGGAVVQWPYPFAPDTEKTLYQTEGTITAVRFSPDGKTLFLTLPDAAGNGPRRGARAAVGGPPAPAGSRLVAVRDGKSVDLKHNGPEDREAATLVIGPTGDARVMGDAAYLSGTQTYEDPTKDAPRPFLERVSLVDGKRERIWQSATDRYETATMLDDAGTRLLVGRQSATLVPQSLTLDLADKKETPLTKNVDYAPDLSLAKRETVIVTRNDGVRFGVKVTSPAGVTRPPALFWIYPSEFEDQAAYDRRQRSLNKNLFNQVGGNNKVALIRLGYAIVEPVDLPIVASREHMNDTYVPQLRNDLSAAIDELDRRNLIDRQRLACGGHSYGAFSTANALVNTPFFRCGIAGDGNYLRPLTPFGFQSDSRQLWEARETYLDISPLLYADQISGALLMYHGMDDQNVGTAPINSERMFTALESLGKPAELVMYPYEDHGQIARETLIDQWARFSSWLDQYLKKS